jgi:hypothetical protein
MSVNRVVEMVTDLTGSELVEVCQKLDRKGIHLFLKTPESAYEHAIRFGDSPRLRLVVVDGPKWALRYALNVTPPGGGWGEGLDLLRRGASVDPRVAYQFATRVDHGPHTVTREGACQDPRHALRYAEKVDLGRHPDTWAAVRGTEFESRYNYNVPGKGSERGDEDE